jgi:DNA-binding PadR family transcriptional regulator
MNDEKFTEDEIRKIGEGLEKKGIVSITMNDEGKTVYRLTELGIATVKNGMVIPSVYLRED